MAKITGTATGLDVIVQTILDDPVIDQKLTTSEVQAGAAAAHGLNDLLVAGVQATGIANNGVINAADVRELNDWMEDNHYSELVSLHGDDNPDTGFHIVRDASYQSPAQFLTRRPYTPSRTVFTTPALAIITTKYVTKTARPRRLRWTR